MIKTDAYSSVYFLFVCRELNSEFPVYLEYLLLQETLFKMLQLPLFSDKTLINQESTRVTPAWSRAHTAPRIHIPKTMKLPRHRGCWCKGPRHVVRTGKEELFNVRITAWGQGVASFNCRWETRDDENPNFHVGAKLHFWIKTECLWGTNLTVERNKAQPHVYYWKYLQGTVWQVYLLLCKTTGDWNSNQTSETSYFYLHY